MKDQPIPPGICQCGECGLPTKKFTRNDTLHGHVKGEYAKYIAGHNARCRPLGQHPWQKRTVPNE